MTCEICGCYVTATDGSHQRWHEREERHRKEFEAGMLTINAFIAGAIAGYENGRNEAEEADA